MKQQTKRMPLAGTTQNKHLAPTDHTNGNLCEAHCSGCAATLSAMAACWLDPNGFSGLKKRSAI